MIPRPILIILFILFMLSSHKHEQQRDLDRIYRMDMIKAHKRMFPRPILIVLFILSCHEREQQRDLDRIYRMKLIGAHKRMFPRPILSSDNQTECSGWT